MSGCPRRRRQLVSSCSSSLLGSLRRTSSRSSLGSSSGLSSDVRGQNMLHCSCQRPVKRSLQVPGQAVRGVQVRHAARQLPATCRRQPASAGAGHQGGAGQTYCTIAASDLSKAACKCGGRPSEGCRPDMLHGNCQRPVEGSLQVPVSLIPAATHECRHRAASRNSTLNEKQAMHMLPEHAQYWCSHCQSS